MARPKKDNEVVDSQTTNESGSETTEDITSVANPHAKAKETSDEQVLDYDPEMGVPIELDDESTDTGTKEYLASVVNGFRYYFPVGHCRSFSEAVQLGSNFIKENLIDGQIFSINPQRLTPFLFIPECGIALNPSNATWIYRKAEVSPVGVVSIVTAVRSGDLVLGEYGITKVVPKMKKAALDHHAILGMNYEAIRAKVIELLNSQVQISEMGEVYSPGVELKALLKLESQLQNRDKVKNLLNEALKRVGGMIQYAEEEEVSKALDDRQTALRNASKAWDERGGVALGVKVGSVL